MKATSLEEKEEKRIEIKFVLFLCFFIIFINLMIYLMDKFVFMINLYEKILLTINYSTVKENLN
jgi:hypothetical protein